MTPFATAWVAPAGTIISEDCQVLVYIAQEVDVIKARHRCTAGGVYMEWDLKWEQDDKWDRAMAYLNELRSQTSEHKADVQKTFHGLYQQSWPIP
jgi:hypothetical protein